MTNFDFEKHGYGIDGKLSWHDIRSRNLNWWKKQGRFDWQEKPSTKKLNYDVFLQDIYDEYGFSLEKCSDKTIAEICCGPYGGILECYDVSCREKIFVDIFMEDFKQMNFIEWSKNSRFIQAPTECIPLKDNSVDVLLGYNSIDHGWDWKKSLEECHRISNECYLMFDTKGELDGDWHPQIITHEDVKEYFSQNEEKYKNTEILIKLRMKDYGYYNTCFEWGETWVYMKKQKTVTL